MDPIKEAFLKIKQDIIFLKEEIYSIRLELKNLLKEQNLVLQQTTPTHKPPSNLHQTDSQTYTPTQDIGNMAVKSLSPLNINSSIGNEGVPTDKPTNQQTDQHPPISSGKPLNELPQNLEDFKKASEILRSLDSLKREIRAKFKRLTPQEMLVFSTLYGLEEQNIPETTYKALSTILGLSESSIRDYINKLLKKGIPLDKIRQNNKTILLQISPDLKKLTTLETIQKLRDL